MATLMNKTHYNDIITLTSHSSHVATSVVGIKDCSKELRTLISPVLCKKKVNHHKKVYFYR